VTRPPKLPDLLTVREALAELPGIPNHKGDEKPVIVDTGCMGSSYGDSADFISDFLEIINESTVAEGMG
jgi:hypothetical protein